MTNTTEEPIIKIEKYNENFKMASKKMLENKVANIRNSNANFIITAGPLIFLHHKYSDTYVLEIDYKKSEETYLRTLPMRGFGQNIFMDYAEKAHELAQQFCDEHNFLINDTINSWPKYQAIVSKKKNN
jgi:hypothetical protein